MNKPLERILVVEDKAGQREELIDELTDAGYKVAGAANSSQAQEIFKEFHPNLVIMDIHMGKPGEIDGVSIAAKLRSMEHPFALVFLTGYDYDYKDTKHVRPQNFLRKSDVLDTETLVMRLEIAWGSYTPFVNKKTSIESNSKIDDINGVFVSLKENIKLGDKDNKPRFLITIEPCNEHIEVSEILMIERVQGAKKKQVRLFMQSGEVFRVSKNLMPFLKYLNKEYLVQINGSVAINAKMREKIIPESGEIFIKIVGMDSKFKNYFSLYLDRSERLGASSLCVSRTYRNRGALNRISKFSVKKRLS